MTSEAAVRAHQTEALSRFRAWEYPYTVQIAGLTLVVHEGVIPPTGTDTTLVVRNLAPGDGRRLLELTTGTGIVSVCAGRLGWTGVACDLNPLAVANATANFSAHDVAFTAMGSDVFSGVPAATFDLIVANPPYLDGPVGDPLEHAFFGSTHFVEELFAGAPGHLTPAGSLLIAFAEWGDIEHFEQTGATGGFVCDVIDSLASDDGDRVYRLYRCVPQQSATRLSRRK